MNMYLALSLFSLIIMIYWVVSELFTILFRFTGLPEEKARFQVISLLTGSGFTTRESEMIISTRSRRRLARVIMLFGYVFNLTIVSALVNVFFSIREDQVKEHYFAILIPVAVAALIIYVIKVPAVHAWADSLLEKLASRLVRKEADNSVMLLDYIGQDVIAQIKLNTVPEAFRGVPLAQTGIKSENNILVMIIEQSDGTAEATGADTVFADGDRITVFGDYDTICRVFEASERFED